MERQPGVKSKTQAADVNFTDEEIDIVIVALEKDANLRRELLSNAQDGNEHDIEFLLELAKRRGITVYDDSLFHSDEN